MQANRSSSSPSGQSIKPSQSTWSSIHRYLPCLSGVGHANRSIPSGAGGHSILFKRKKKIRKLKIFSSHQINYSNKLLILFYFMNRFLIILIIKYIHLTYKHKHTHTYTHTIMTMRMAK